MTTPIVHKLVEGWGDDTPAGLIFGLGRLRHFWQMNPQGSFAEKWPIGAAMVYVQQSGKFQSVRVVAGGDLRYEFFTSEKLDATYHTPGYPGYVGGAAMRTAFLGAAKTPKTEPLFSTTLTPGPDDTWLLRATDAPSIDKATRLRTWASWQNQHFVEEAWYLPKNGGMVGSTKSQDFGAANKCNWRSPYFTTIYVYGGDALYRDYGRDVPPALYKNQGAVVGYPAFEDAWVYWRHAAVQKVAGDNGGQFFICTDNYGRFHVYRVLDRNPTWAAVPGQYKTYTPPYPVWVTVPDAGDFMEFDSDWLWQFNADATKCVAIPMHREATGFKKYAPPPTAFDPHTPPGGSLWATMLPEDVPTNITHPEWIVDAHEDTPGLVEFSIAITPTGPGDMEFDVTFTLLRSSYFGDDHRFFFDAGYFLNDVEKIGIAADTLLTAEIECLVPAGYYEATIGSPVVSTDGVRNMQSACLIQSNDGVMSGTELLRFPLWSPVYLQYPNDYNIRTYGAPSPMYLDPLTEIPFGAYGGSNVETASGDVAFYPVGPKRYSDAGLASRPLHAGFIFSMHLSSFSILYQVNDFTTQAGYVRGMAFGKEFYRQDFTLTSAVRTLPAYLPTAEVVPSARPYNTIFTLSHTTNPATEFVVHPSGNWSMIGSGNFARDPSVAWAVALVADLDWVSVITGKNADGTPIRTRYRHRDMYNAAFTQTRDYSFYLPTPPGSEYGSFRTAGFWVSF